MSPDLRSPSVSSSPIDSLISTLSKLVEEESMMIDNLNNRTQPICSSEPTMTPVMGNATLKTVNEMSSVEAQLTVVVDHIRRDMEKLQSMLSRLRI